MRSNTRTRVSWVFILWGALASLVVFGGDPDFTVYHSRFRSAEELARIAGGLLGGSPRLQVMDDKIIVYGTVAEAEKALRLFGELDRRGRQYRVFLRARDSGAGHEAAAALEVDGQAGPVHVQKRSGVLAPGARGAVRVGGASVSGQSLDFAGRGNAGSYVLVSEGEEAALGTAEGFLPSGLAVKLRALGKKGVHVDLFQQNSRGIRFQNISTKLDLPLGQWRSIGAASQNGERAAGEILGGAKERSAGGHEVELKVELASQEEGR